MIYDKDFLLQLDKTKNKVIYARITALTFDERPIETIEGKITQGSINVDGVSAVRRTCSLTMVAENFNYQNYYWGINTKFKLEIGVQNFINPKYPDIIWFKQGIYLFTSFNTSRATNNFTISLQGKDKMCLLNGEVGGSLESQVDFGTIQEETLDGIWSITKIPIKDIIRNAVHVYAGEPYHNIIIKDIDIQGLELLEYRYDIPMYLYRETNSPVFSNMTLDGNIKCWVKNDEGELKEHILQDLDSTILDPLITPLTGSTGGQPVVFSTEENALQFYVAKIEYGQTAGYRMTDLTFAGDLICNVGESVMSMLDKIKNMLSEFEYFYNVDGQFVFQKKQSFVNTLWSPTQIADTIGTNSQGEDIYYSEQYIESMANSSATSYIFNEGELITAFTNNPNILNMRNDYSVWGVRKTISGADMPIHMRYAIDTKPIRYTTIEVDYEELKQGDVNTAPSIEYGKDYKAIEAYNKKYGKRQKGQKSKTYSTDIVDWREIIYRMAKDYYAYNHLDDFEAKVAKANTYFYEDDNGNEYAVADYPSGRTGYEKYYTDLLGFWRDIYYPIEMEKAELEEKNNSEIIQKMIKDLQDIWIPKAYSSQKIEYEDLVIKLQSLLDEDKTAEKKEDLEKKKENYYDKESEHKYWNKDVYEKPYILNFWFDFLDTNGELSQFKTQNIGFRTKAVNDNNVKSIYFRETPDIVFYENEDEIDRNNTAYRYIQITDIKNMFSISAQGKSAKDKVDELLYQHGYCIESATITTIPIYYLQPNTRIHLFDQKTNLDGDYIVSKMTIPLAHNGTMQITATKAAERII